MEKLFVTEPDQLSAALCDAHGEMSMASLETRLIVAATRHADMLGIGYRDLMRDRNVWVLSRMSVEVSRMPGILDTYSIATWIESYSRHISYRNFALLDGEGNPIGYARSLWTCINIDTRRPSSLHQLDAELERDCPIAPIPRLGAVGGDECLHGKVSFTYSDIDFNRHVNSARYVERIADLFDLVWHDRNRIQRLDIAYLRETHCADNVEAVYCQDGDRVDVDINGSDGVTMCRARLTIVTR